MDQKDLKHKSVERDTSSKFQRYRVWKSNNRVKFYDKYNRSKSIIAVILACVLLVLLVSYIVRQSTNDGNLGIPTFTSLMEKLSSADIGTLELTFEFAKINFGDWGLFNFLRDFFMFFAKLIDIGNYCLVSLLNLFVFVWNIALWVFGY